MTVVFASNYLNHHQLPFCKAMEKLTKEDFFFIATTPISEERAEFGYRDMNKSYSFVICAYEDKKSMEKAITLINSADTVISGSVPEELLRERLENKKILFRYSERLYKQGYIYLFAPKRRAVIKKYHLAYKDKPVYMLCASSFTAGDFALNGAYKNRCYKWGYFPEVKIHNLDSIFARKRVGNTVSILWAGRLIELKHPDVPILLAEKLKRNGFDFKLTIIGSGEMRDQLQVMIQKKDLSDCVTMTGSMSPEDVRTNMENSDIFLFTSDYHEGWGAVLNESMNSACAVVSSDAVGSTGFLVHHKENGLIYRSGSLQDLYMKTVALCKSAKVREQLGRAAYATILNEWNPEIAAERFLELSRDLKSGKPTPYNDGPCSAAPCRYGGVFYKK